MNLQDLNQLRRTTNGLVHPLKQHNETNTETDTGYEAHRSYAQPIRADWFLGRHGWLHERKASPTFRRRFDLLTGERPGPTSPSRWYTGPECWSAFAPVNSIHFRWRASHRWIWPGPTRFFAIDCLSCVMNDSRSSMSDSCRSYSEGAVFPSLTPTLLSSILRCTDEICARNATTVEPSRRTLRAARPERG